MDWSVAAPGTAKLKIVSYNGATPIINVRPSTWVTTWVPQTVLTTVCNGVEDRYRFGFNGQHKTNEIAGLGNHNTALFWEYDTRLARRWNLDPKVKASESPYSVFSGNPIWFIDPLGDDTFKVFIPQSKWPNVYMTHLKGIDKNPQIVSKDFHVYITYDPTRSNANKRRAAAKKANGMDGVSDGQTEVDEFPYASTKEGGSNAATNRVPRKENRQHGQYLGQVVVLNKMTMDDVFDVVMIPNPPEKNKAPLFSPDAYGQRRLPIMGYPGQGVGQLLSDVVKWLSGKRVKVPDPVVVPVPATVPIPAIAP